MASAGHARHAPPTCTARRGRAVAKACERPTRRNCPPENEAAVPGHLPGRHRQAAQARHALDGVPFDREDRCETGHLEDLHDARNRAKQTHAAATAWRQLLGRDENAQTCGGDIGPRRQVRRRYRAPPRPARPLRPQARDRPRILRQCRPSRLLLPRAPPARSCFRFRSAPATRKPGTVARSEHVAITGSDPAVTSPRIEPPRHDATTDNGA